jgi:serine-type D-Ala-D-Ala endopeptidase (penicillin-binding protein 7)
MNHNHHPFLSTLVLAAAALLAACGRAPAPATPAPPTAAVAPPAAAPVAEPPAVAASAAAAPQEEEGDPQTAESASPPVNPNLSFGRLAGLHRAPDGLRLTASAAIVVEADGGKVLYKKNEQAVLPIASLTKLMTGLVIAQAGLPMDEMLTITQDDVDTARNSRSRLRVGTALPRGEALHLALMSSENRAAHALGRTFPGGLQAFVDAMNNQARALGLESTTFVDPTGLSNRNQSNVRDLALLAGAASRHALLREYSTTPRYQAALGKRTLQYVNSNRLVKDPDWEILLQKTGYIVEAGQCLAMRTRMGGREVILVLLDAGSKASRSADAQRLRRWVVAEAASARSGTS